MYLVTFQASQYGKRLPTWKTILHADLQYLGKKEIVKVQELFDCNITYFLGM